MSGEAIGWVFRKVQMDDATAKFVLVAICNYANENDEAWPSHSSVARLTGLSKRTIQNSIQKLEDWGLIKRIRRDRENGSETSAMVSIDLDVSWIVKGGIATPAIGGVQQLPRGIAGAATLEPTLKPKSKDSARSKKSGVNDPIDYSEEFETKVWQAWPHKDGSKKKAYDYWNMLNDENRARVIAAIPAFAAKMKREGRPTDKIPHLTTWFNGRIWETSASVAPAAPSAASDDWYKTATREQWAKVLERWQGTDHWSRSWGPDPSQSGCRVPKDLMAAHNLKYRAHLFHETDLVKFRQLVEHHHQEA